MCGIFAVIQRGIPIDEASLRAAVTEMAHRGPDAQGILLRTVQDADTVTHIGLGHRRLAILDLDPRSNQPFVREGAATIFNGEIFNFRELRDSCRHRLEFATSGDTEVLAEMIRLDGPGISSRFSGQWAFVQHKDGEPRICLGRDTYGKKPLFYFLDADRFIVSSTIKAIYRYLGGSPSFNRKFIADFFFHTMASCGGAATPFEDVFQLEPSHVATFSFRTWSLETTRVFNRKPDLPPTSDRKELADRIEKAVLKRLASDRPVGLLLSGGVDSTLILSVLKKTGQLPRVACFIGDVGNSDDTRYALDAIASFGATARTIRIDYEANSFEQFLQACAHQERPFRLQGNLMGIPQLYREVAQTDIKVVLDGTGADEIFGGYWDRYFPFALREALRKLDIPWLTRTFAANAIEPRRLSYALRVLGRGGSDFVCPEIDEMARNRSGTARAVGPSSDPLSRMNLGFDEALETDIFEGRLSDWLWQNDRNSMMYGIEARSPFMDIDLYPQVFGGYRSKFHGVYNKYELRKAFDQFLPLRAQWRRQKQGFRWSAVRFLGENRKEVEDLCISSRILGEMFPDLLGKMRDRQSLPTEIVEKLLSIAGVESRLCVS